MLWNVAGKIDSDVVWREDTIAASKMLLHVAISQIVRISSLQSYISIGFCDLFECKARVAS